MADDLRLRLATVEDSERLRAWRNDPEVVASTFSGRPVEATEHQAWLELVLKHPGERLMVAEAGGRPVGQVRLQVRSGGEVEVHIGLAADARGRGLGRTLLDMAAERAAEDLAAHTLVARVRADNDRSLRAFAAAGFRERARGEGEVLLQRRLR